MSAPSSAPSVFPRWLAGLGLALLVVSFAVASLAWKANPEEPASSVPTAPVERAVAVAHVDVEGGVLYPYPTRPGRVVEVPFKEGDVVKEGDLLLRVDDTLAKIELQRAQTALSAAKTKLGQAKLLVRQHELKATALRAAVEVQQREAEAAQEQARKARRFFDEKLGGSEEDARAAEKMVEKAQAGIRARQAELDVLLSMDPKVAVDLATDDVNDKQLQVDLAKKGVRECEVRAPCKGTLLRAQVSVGVVLSPTPDPRMLPLVFCPSTERIIRAEVEQEFVGSLHVGQTARIRDDATGSGEWKGKVTRISDWYTHRRSILLEPMQFNDVRTLEAIITVDPGSPPLRVGQRVRVTLGD